MYITVSLFSGNFSLFIKKAAAFLLLCYTERPLLWWHDIPAGPKVPDIINVIVEIPKGSQNKYEYDKKTNMIRLDRVLFSPIFYVGDYGMIPQTLSEDGDALDVLVLVTNPTYPGILIEARPIGLLKMKDGRKIDNKILCVANNDPRYSGYKNIHSVEEHTLKEISHFFQVYKDLEGKKVQVIGWESATKAKKIIQSAIRSYKDQKTQQ
jgi:inorganic pyrophosphatase